MELGFTVRIFKKDRTFVAHVPELDISSSGETEADVRWNIVDAVKRFIESAKEAGTLNKILEEAGYRLENGSWKEPELVGLEHMSIGLR